MKNTEGNTKQLRDELKTSLESCLGRHTNEKTGIEAYLSAKSINKLGSGKAIEKSKNNGFSVAQHFEVACNVTKLYEKADLVSSRPSKKPNDTSTLSIKRFSASTILKDGTKVKAYITVKETVQTGHRIYSVELMPPE